MTRKSFFYISSCYEDNENVAPYVDRYVLLALQAIRLILLWALCEIGNTGMHNTTKRTEVNNGILEHG
jgi:hypothetical protein